MVGKGGGGEGEHAIVSLVMQKAALRNGVRS